MTPASKPADMLKIPVEFLSKTFILGPYLDVDTLGLNMTAFALAEKSAEKDEPNPGELKPAARRQRKPIFVALISAIITGLVFSGIFVGCTFYWYHNTNTNTNTNSQTSEEWIFWSRSFGNVTIHESALLNEEEQTALMISAEAHKIHDDNSLALHDFKKGFVALRDFNAGLCFVTRIQFPDFSYVRKLIEARQGRQLPRQPIKRMRLRADVMTSSELGPKLTEFCDGVSARWFEESHHNENGGRSRRNVAPRVLCFVKVFEIE